MTVDSKKTSVDPPANTILEALYKWATGSGRIVWFTSKLTTAFKPEMQKGSPYFNLEVLFFDQYYNKEYRRMIELFNSRGLAVEFHFFGDCIDLGDLYPISSKTGGRFYFYDTFDLQK